MTPRVLRIAALPVGLVFDGAVVVATWRHRGWTGGDMLWRFGAEVLGYLVALGGYVALACWAQRWKLRSSRLYADGRRFVATGSALVFGPITIMYVALGTSISVTVPFADDPASTAVPKMAAVQSLFLLMALVPALGHAPAVWLTPAGIEIRRALSLRRISWDALQPGAIFVQQRKHPRYLTLGLIGAPVTGWPPTEPVPVGQLATDPYQLAAAINLYAAHPDRRHAVGTKDELVRLYADLDQDAPRAGMLR